MPCDYKKYPADWKSRIRPDILKRAENKCEVCGVPNYKIIFRGILNGEEVYQDGHGDIYSADNSQFIDSDFFAEIESLSGDPNARAIKVVLTISHIDHDTQNNDYGNLKAMCQRCHNRHDAQFRANNRTAKKSQIKLF